MAVVGCRYCSRIKTFARLRRKILLTCFMGLTVSPNLNQIVQEWPRSHQPKRNCSLRQSKTRASETWTPRISLNHRTSLLWLSGCTTSGSRSARRANTTSMRPRSCACRSPRTAPRSGWQPSARTSRPSPEQLERSRPTGSRAW